MDKSRIFYNIGIVLLIIGFLYIVYHVIIDRFNNPNLTETQLFIKNASVYVIGIIIILIGKLITIIYKRR